jgi:hypothetical protein
MRLDKLEDVNKAVKIIQKIDTAMMKLKESYEAEKADCEGILGYAEFGYSCHLSDHIDGSGHPVDLSGCYVGGEVKKAVAEVLTQKRDQMVGFLIDCGVTV